MDIRCRLADVMVSLVTAAPVCVSMDTLIFNGTISSSQIVSGAKNTEEIVIRKPRD